MSVSWGEPSVSSVPCAFLCETSNTFECLRDGVASRQQRPYFFGKARTLRKQLWYAEDRLKNLFTSHSSQQGFQILLDDGVVSSRTRIMCVLAVNLPLPRVVAQRYLERVLLEGSLQKPTFPVVFQLQRS